MFEQKKENFQVFEATIQLKAGTIRLVWHVSLRRRVNSIMKEVMWKEAKS